MKIQVCTYIPGNPYDKLTAIQDLSKLEHLRRSGIAILNSDFNCNDVEYIMDAETHQRQASVLDYTLLPLTGEPGLAIDTIKADREIERLNAANKKIDKSLIQFQYFSFDSDENQKLVAHLNLRWDLDDVDGVEELQNMLEEGALESEWGVDQIGVLFENSPIQWFYDFSLGDWRQYQNGCGLTWRYEDTKHSISPSKE